MAKKYIANGEVAGGALSIEIAGVPNRKLRPLSLIGSVDSAAVVTMTRGDSDTLMWKVKFENGGIIGKAFNQANEKPWETDYGEKIKVTISASTSLAVLALVAEESNKKIF